MTSSRRALRFLVAVVLAAVAGASADAAGVQMKTALLSCSKDCVDDLIARGKLEAVKLGNRRVGVKMRSIERVAEMGVGCLSHGHTKRERPGRRSEALL